MYLLILGLFLLLLIILSVKYKISIDFMSFTKKGFSARRGWFGVYCFCGKQGTGKTFATVNFLMKNQDKKIFANIHLQGIKYTYFSSFDEMLKIKDENCIIVYDEIFSALDKRTPITRDVLTFLSQQRKNKVIFITTAQEWMEIPMTLRRYVRFQIDCSILNVLPFSILIQRYRNGELLKWDKDENEYVAPIISTKISKMNKLITFLYDTNEVIDVSAKSPDVATAERPPRALNVAPERARHFKVL